MQKKTKPFELNNILLLLQYLICINDVIIIIGYNNILITKVRRFICIWKQTGLKIDIY